MNEIDLLKRKLLRERNARKQAEQILESKALELYEANSSLQKLNESLESQISQRTKDLQESEAKYRNVIERASDIIYSTDEEGYFTFINPLGSNAFGFSQDEIIGKRYIDFVLEEYKLGLFEYYTKVRDGGADIDYYEFPIQSKSGKIHWIGQNVNRIEKPNGEVFFNAVARDITQRKVTERDLEYARQATVQSEVKYRSVLENLELGLMEVDTKGIIMRVYDKFCAMTGYSHDELVGKDAIDTLIVEGYEDVLRNQDKNRLEGQSDVYEVKIKRKDGKHIWVIISGAPFYNSEGEIIGSLGIHFDITDRKVLEQNLDIERKKAVKAQRAEQQFLANMSHEIRTPLNAIIGMSHLLKDSNLKKKQEEYVEILNDSAGLLKGLVSDILDISKIDSGRAVLHETTFDLGELARRLVNTFTHQALEKGLSLIPEMGCTKTCLVKSDRQWINQILINLLSNAVKFTSSGEVYLIMKKIKSSTDSGVYYFEVKDTGIGIEENEIENVFTAFKQANTKVRKDFGGTGLGLSIASRLVSLLGGELEVESESGKGSRFFFSISLQSSGEEALKPLNIKDYKLDEGRKINVLVVEDNIMNQKYILTLLKKWRINYDVADNGQIAVDKFKLNHYDMIFMDLSMPVMDGYEATGIIRTLDESQTPIIALTASTFLSKKELALKAGMTDFLAKPFIPDELSQMIQKHLPEIKQNGQPEIADFVFGNKLNRDQLIKIYGSDHTHALDMFETYKSIVFDELSNLKSSILKNDAEEVRKQAHKIKPIFLMVGLNHISEMCEEIEKMTENENFHVIEQLNAKIEKNIKNSIPLVDDEIERMKKITSG